MSKIIQNILFQIVVPFRPNIFPIEIIEDIDNNPIQFLLHYDINKLFKIYTHDHQIRTLESTSIIEINVKEIKVPEAKEHFINRNLKVKLLEIINRFIDIIRYSHYKENNHQKVHLRNIGLDDIIRSHLVIDGKLKNSSHKVSFQKDNNDKSYNIEQVIKKIPYSWKTLTKAIDLLELGYYNESLIVGFNLLDYCVQETLKRNMNNLNDKEKQLILRKIETQRLETYLGTFLKLVTGKNIYNKELTERDLKRLNKFRNEVIHGGKDSSYHETAKYLQTIYSILRSLNEFGMDYELQNRMILL